MADPPQPLLFAAISDQGIAIAATITVVCLASAFAIYVLLRRLRAQIAVARSEARYFRLIIEAAFDAVVEIDSRGLLIAWTDRAQRTLGWSRSDVIGKRIDSIIAIDDARQVLRADPGVFDTRTLAEIPHRLAATALHRDGRKLPIQMTLATLENASQTAVAAFVRVPLPDDGAKPNRNPLPRTVTGGAALTKVLAHISYKARTPISALIEVTTLLLSTGLDTVQREYVETIRRTGKALQSSANDIQLLAAVSAVAQDSATVHGLPGYVTPSTIPAGRPNIGHANERFLAPVEGPDVAAGILPQEPRGGHSGSGSQSSTIPNALEPPVDWQGLVASLRGDTVFAHMLTGIFIATSMQSMAQINSAHNKGDYAAVRESARAFKVICGNIRATAAHAAAMRCEAAAHSHVSYSTSTSIEVLNAEVERTIAYLQMKLD
jgi:PAS domain S-box-containing protein